jgi:hypothetical protein
VYKEQLPRTRLALAALVETTEQFALRRIRWAADQFSSQQLKPNRWELMRVAGIGPSTRDIPSVERAITEAKARLDSGENTRVGAFSPPELKQSVSEVCAPRNESENPNLSEATRKSSA